MIGLWRSRLEPAARAALIEPVPRDHAESDAAFHRRRVVVLVTLASGTSLLGLSLSVRPGGFAFYPLTLAVALVWIVGGFLSGPLHWGSAGAGGRWQRPVVSPIVIGLAAAAVFVVGALVVREIPPLRDYVQHVLNHARRGSLTAVFVLTLLNGAAEEIFFRGGLYAAVGRRRPVVISTVIYAVATVATGNPVLVFAALTLGFVLALQRRASGGILAPMLTHVVWSAVLFVALPPLF